LTAAWRGAVVRTSSPRDEEVVMRRNRAVVLGLLALLLMLGTSATVSAGPRPQAAVRAPVVDVQGAIEATHR